MTMSQGPQELEGPHYSTVGWDKDHNGVHPVEMLARIAKFEAKQEATYEPHRRTVRGAAGHDTRKVVCCRYDNFAVLGNGKLEKQAKLVAARNMICKIKTANIGIVNETLAAGVTLDPGVNPNPHKKPLVRQFKSFTSGGTLGNFKSAGSLASSFVSASSSSTSLTSQPSPDIVTPPVCTVNDTDSLEIEQYQAYIEGKIESPTEKLPPKMEDTEETNSSVTAEPKIVFKRSVESTDEHIAPAGDDSEPNLKKTKVGDDKSSEQSGDKEWDSSNYGCNSASVINSNSGHQNEAGPGSGFHNNPNIRGRGGGWNNRGFNRGFNNSRGRGYGSAGGHGYGYGYGGGYYNYGYGGGGW